MGLNETTSKSIKINIHVALNENKRIGLQYEVFIRRKIVYCKASRTYKRRQTQRIINI